MKNNRELISQYLSLYPARSLSQRAIDEVEKRLSIVLPIDFKEISRVYDGYEILGGHALFSFDPLVENYNILEKTLYYRNSSLKLPHRFVALEETEVSFIVLETHLNMAEKTKVIECAIEDVYNLASEKPLIYNPTIFPAFASFFEFLLEQEKKERGEA